MKFKQGKHESRLEMLMSSELSDCRQVDVLSGLVRSVGVRKSSIGLNENSYGV